MIREEIRQMIVRTSIGHGEDSGPSVLEAEVLIRKLRSVDGPTPRSIAMGEVSPLAHEARDHSVEFGTLRRVFSIT